RKESPTDSKLRALAFKSLSDGHLLLWCRREVFKHLLQCFVEFLSVLLRLVRKLIGGRSPENELLGMGVQEIHHQRAHVYSVLGGLCHPASPAPAAAAVEGIERLLLLHGAVNRNQDVRTIGVRGLRPS